jgi:hypothetical protein
MRAQGVDELAGQAVEGSWVERWAGRSFLWRLRKKRRKRINPRR